MKNVKKKKIFCKIFWVGPFFKGRSGNRRQDYFFFGPIESVTNTRPRTTPDLYPSCAFLFTCNIHVDMWGYVKKVVCKKNTKNHSLVCL